MKTGYAGRTGVYEILVIDDVVRQMIVERRPAHDIVAAARESQGFRTMREDALDKVVKGITTLEEAASAVMI
jgi:type IV pilus assembly protein PilB